jgi:hypothetical protein
VVVPDGSDRREVASYIREALRCWCKGGDPDESFYNQFRVKKVEEVKEEKKINRGELERLLNSMEEET